ncbi:MAG: glycoside hydrolase family 78 protein [Pirellulales bacterium]|nr:glycoside hydrolase family 78 protein [Pirellulales bacterium]
MRFLFSLLLAFSSLFSSALAESPATTEYLRCEYKVDPLGIDVLQPRLSWEMHDARRGAKQTAYQILVASTPEKLAADQGDLWDSGKIESNRTAQIDYAGEPLKSRMRCHWKVRLWDHEGQASTWSKPALWTMGLLEPGEFQAKWIGLEPVEKEAAAPPEKKAPDSAGKKPKEKPAPMGCPLLRKEFTVDQPLRRATLYASALGVYRMHVNGKPVGNDYFTPDWTDYHKRVYYNAYDVTDLLKQGPNALAGILGPGWYAGPIAWWDGGKLYGPYPRLLAQLEIELADGSRMTVATDGSWKTTRGPVLEGEFLAGETYDATQEIPGWDRPGLDDAKWRPVQMTDKVAARLQAFPGVTVQETGILKPAKITEPQPGKYVFDLGRNFTGVVRLKVKGPRGTRIVLRFAERLNPDGTIYTANLRGARATDTYVLRGDGDEIYQPRFTFHGFQYVEVSGYPGRPGLDAITGVALNSAIPLVGEFECSNPMLNKLFSNIVWTQRGNYLSVPTDCPQRDERLGWMGDAEVFIRTGTYCADVAAFFTKWMVDVDDAQGAEGDFPNFAPRVVDKAPGSAAWGDAGVICPCTLYWVYNDRRLLEKCYPAMTRWVEFCRKHSDHLLRPNEGYGDWLNIKADTPRDVLATAYFAESARLTARAAKILGKEDDAKKYMELFDEIKSAFNKAYVAADGRIKGNTQTCYVLALAFELLPPEKRETAVRYLLEDIKARDGRLSTGFVGTSLLMPTLSRFGRTPTAYALALSEKFPSWGFTVKHGATSIWERWDGWTPEKGFQDPGMNSFAHYAFGAVGQWLFQTMAGIDTQEPGFQKILIRPELGEGIDWVKASYRSLHGEIASAWKREGSKLVLDVTIPANTTAKVSIPVNVNREIEREKLVSESGRPLSEAPRVKVIGKGKSQLSVDVEVEAGQYHFETHWK